MYTLFKNIVLLQRNLFESRKSYQRFSTYTKF